MPWKYSTSADGSVGRILRAITRPPCARIEATVVAW
jgi:hypothetical protein